MVRQPATIALVALLLAGCAHATPIPIQRGQVDALDQPRPGGQVVVIVRVTNP